MFAFVVPSWLCRRGWVGLYIILNIAKVSVMGQVFCGGAGSIVHIEFSYSGAGSGPILRDNKVLVMDRGLAAFDAIRALNVVHGDVRPENIRGAEDGNKVWIIDFEDGQIIADGDEAKESDISNEMEEVHRMLWAVKKGPGRIGCLPPVAESEIPTQWISSLEVC
jgi:hypothetical protein